VESTQGKRAGTEGNENDGEECDEVADGQRERGTFQNDVTQLSQTRLVFYG
jgi:hypothetical protein